MLFIWSSSPTNPHLSPNLWTSSGPPPLTDPHISPNLPTFQFVFQLTGVWIQMKKAKANEAAFTWYTGALHP